MDRMKTFFKYFLVLVIFYFFSTIMINSFLKVSYTELENYSINTQPLFVDVTEAEASKRDGHIYGVVKNNSDTVIENKYLKFSMLSKNENVLGTKYVKIEKIEVNQLYNYEVEFDYDNVKSFKIELTDSMPEKVDFIELIKTNASDYINGIN